MYELNNIMIGELCHIHHNAIYSIINNNYDFNLIMNYYTHWVSKLNDEKYLLPFTEDIYYNKEIIAYISDSYWCNKGIKHIISKNKAKDNETLELYKKIYNAASNIITIYEIITSEEKIKGKYTGINKYLFISWQNSCDVIKKTYPMICSSLIENDNNSMIFLSC